MTTYLPKDVDDNPIPAVRLSDGGAHEITTGASSVRNSTAFNADTRLISLYATEDVYVNFGDDTVTAANTDHFFPKGVYYDLAIGGGKVNQYTHVAALQVSAAGKLYISEKE